MTTIVSGSSITFNDNTTQNTSAYGGGFAFRNRIINGDMRIDQRNAGASLTPTTDGQYNLDRFQVYISQASKFSVQQNAGSVTPPAGFNYYAGITSLSAYTVGSSDYFCFVQNIEGYNIGDFAWGTASAKTVTLSFWVRSSLTGTFGGSIRNGAANYSFPFNYTISSANTWEQKTVTITAPTSGTWTTTNTSGLQVIFGLGVGSTNSGTANAWTGSSVLSATGATSVVGTNGATWYITGVQLEKGSTATSFDYRPYGQELALCQRYLYHWDSTADLYARVQTGVIFASNSIQVQINLPVAMRSAPTLSSYSSASTFRIVSAGSAFTGSSITSTESNNLVAGMNFGFTGGTSGNCGWVSANNTSSAYFNLSAEL